MDDHNSMLNKICQVPEPLTPIKGYIAKPKPSYNKAPDYDYWLKMSDWGMEEAIFLLNDVDPRSAINYSERNKLFDNEYSNIGKTFQLLSRSIENGELDKYDRCLISPRSAKHKPYKYIKWAKQKGIDIPEQLLNILHINEMDRKQTERAKEQKGHAHEGEDTDNERQYIFKTDKDTCHIKFNNVDVHIGTTIGMHYINYLLHHPNEEVGCIKLKEIHQKNNGSETINKFQAAQHLGYEQENENASDDFPKLDDDYQDVLSDQKAINECKKNSKTLKEAKANLDLEIKEENNPEKREELKAEKTKYENEITKIEKHLNSVTNKNGKLRVNNRYERCRKHVQKFISIAIKKIEKYCNEKKFGDNLSKHLEKHISTGRYCIYSPSHKIEWK